MKRLFIMTILACASAMAGDGRLSVPSTHFTLSNGLDVILHEDHTLPMIAVNIWYHAGSAREKKGRTGLAHLFEHIMFKGSKDVPEGKFEEWLEAAGGDNNGSTTQDRTNYYEDIPSNALELPLFLESDRMGFLVDAMSPEKVDGQRDVVKNERREDYENQPYGLAPIMIGENLYPDDHPYRWPVIGSMEDLSSASYDDVVDFFKRYYVPANASLVIAGDIDPVKAKQLVEHWFSDVPAGAPVPPQPVPVAFLSEEKRLVLEDKVQIPRLYIAWHTPAQFAPGDAELDLLAYILAGDKNSRLYKRLVYDLEIAQDVTAGQASRKLGSVFQVVVTARPGYGLTEIEAVVQEEINRIRSEPPSQRELDRAVNKYEASFLDRLDDLGEKADLLNEYFSLTGNPDYFNEDLARYKALDPQGIRSVASTYLRDNGRVVLSVVPGGRRELSAGKENRR